MDKTSSRMDKKMQIVNPMRPIAQTTAELLPEITALQGATPREPQQSTSTKVDPTKSLTGDGQMKHSTVRKGYNFRSKPKPRPNVGKIAVAALPRKSNRPQAKAGGNAKIRLSGLYKLPETPVILKPKRKPKQKSILPCRMAKKNSFEFNDDDSFIQSEKEINEFESKCDALTDLIERKTESNLTTINNCIQMLNSMKEEQSEYLKQIKKLIHEIKETDATTCNNNTVMPNTVIEPENLNKGVEIKETEATTCNNNTVIPNTIIYSCKFLSFPKILIEISKSLKSPSYKIPRKSLLKKVLYKYVSRLRSS